LTPRTMMTTARTTMPITTTSCIMNPCWAILKRVMSQV